MGRYDPTDAEIAVARDELATMVNRYAGRADAADRASTAAHLTLGTVDAVLEHAARACTAAELAEYIRRARAAIEAQKLCRTGREEAGS